MIERGVLLSDSATFASKWLQLSGPATAAKAKKSPTGGLELPFDGSLSLEDMDKFIIQAALERTDYNVTAAARLLGTTRQTLRYRAQKYELNLPGTADSSSQD